MTESRAVSPEWLTTTRADFVVDEALRGGWGVSPAPLSRGASFTDFGTHEMAVPHGDSDEARAIRLHELIHARVSPTAVPSELIAMLGVTKDAVRLAEEVRVNHLARVHGNAVRASNPESIVGDIALLSDGTERATADKAVEQNDWQTALSLYLSTLNTNVHKVVKRRLRRNKDWREPLDVVSRYIADNTAYASADHSISPTLLNTRTVRSGLGATIPVEYVYKDRLGRETRQIMPTGFIHNTLPLAEIVERWMNHPPRKAPKGRHAWSHYLPGKPELETPSNSNWVPLSFGIVPLTESTSSFLGRRKRPAMVGKYPVRPDRLLTDPERRIFRETVRGRGGIVVFDCSGSMGVTHEIVRDTVKQFAGATVVVYSTSSGSVDAPYNAWVVAHNGRMVSAEDFDALPLHSGNGVDGEILRWAVRNRKGKEFVLWVSDGHVTGKHDRMSNDLIAECAVLSARHKILGVDTCEEAIALLSDMKRGRVPRERYCRVMRKALDQIRTGKEVNRDAFR